MIVLVTIAKLLSYDSVSINFYMRLGEIGQLESFFVRRRETLQLSAVT